MSPTQLHEFEEATTITETFRHRVREAIVRANAEQPERALLFISYDEVVGMDQLSEGHTSMVSRQLEGYVGHFDASLEATADWFRLYPYHFSRHSPSTTQRT